MKLLKTTISLIMAGLLACSMTACHPKDETALTVGGVKISSALYMAALIQADGEAKNKVSEQEKSNTSSSASSTTSEIDYYSKSIDGKKFVTYVKEKALEICKEFAAYDVLKKEGKFTITDDKLKEADSVADYYWNNYGYNTVYQDNGVSLATYKKQLHYTYMADAYFLSQYGKGGAKAVDTATIQNTMKEKYEVVKRIDASFTSEMTDAEKTALKTKFADYEKRLKAGTSFEKIYNEYNNVDESTTSSSASTSSENQINMSESSSSTSGTSSSTSSANTSSAATSSGEAKLEAKDKNATVVGAEDTTSADPNFADIKKMKVGEIKLFELADSAGLSLVVRGDITSDPFYLQDLNDAILRLLKKDEFDKSMKEYAAKLEVKENNFAINRFSVKEIKYPTANAAS